MDLLFSSLRELDGDFLQPQLSEKRQPRKGLFFWAPSCPLFLAGGSVRPFNDSYLVDPASSHMLVSKIKPCMSKYKQLYTVKLQMAH
jgi:hypothetical protein